MVRGNRASSGLPSPAMARRTRSQRPAAKASWRRTASLARRPVRSHAHHKPTSRLHLGYPDQVLNAYGQDVGPDGLTAAARGAATRERILREAFVLIGDVGWSRVTTRLLGRRAGVNAALINHHFRCKDSLLREAAAAGIAELLGPAIE